MNLILHCSGNDIAKLRFGMGIVYGQLTVLSLFNLYISYPVSARIFRLLIPGLTLFLLLRNSNVRQNIQSIKKKSHFAHAITAFLIGAKKYQ